MFLGVLKYDRMVLETWMRISGDCYALPSFSIYNGIYWLNRGLFREAHMSNAVLFFDECEAAFRSRDRGGVPDFY